MNTTTTIEASESHDSYQAHLLATSRLRDKVNVAVKRDLKTTIYIYDSTLDFHQPHLSVVTLLRCKVYVAVKHSSKIPIYIYNKSRDSYHANSSASITPIQKYMYPPKTLLPHLQAQRSRNRRSKHTHHTHTHRRRRTRMLRRTDARRTGWASILRTISRRTSTISLRALQPLRTRIQQPLHHLKRIKHLAQIAVRGRVSLPPLLASPREPALRI
jgi:hypothetical protein